METVKATATWSPDADRYCVWNEAASGQPFVPEPLAGTALAAVLLELDETERETGRIVGVEILGFLSFDCWDDLPKLDLLWQLPGQQPLPLDELLKREQQRLRREALAATP
jgi:hypothetical protein